MTDKVFSKLRANWNTNNIIQRIELNKHLMYDQKLADKDIWYNNVSKSISAHVGELKLEFKENSIKVNNYL